MPKRTSKTTKPLNLSMLVEMTKKFYVNGAVDADFEANFDTRLIEALGLSEHPRATKLVSIAWTERHANGYLDVISFADELAELLRPEV